MLQVRIILDLALTSSLFNGMNHLDWSCQAQMVMWVKLKLRFTELDRCDYIMTFWIINSNTQKLANVEVVDVLWKEVVGCFRQCNGPLIYQWKRKYLCKLLKALSIATYFTKLEELGWTSKFKWDSNLFMWQTKWKNVIVNLLKSFYKEKKERD